MRTENMREPENKLNTSGPYVEDKVQSVEMVMIIHGASRGPRRRRLAGWLKIIEAPRLLGREHGWARVASLRIYVEEDIVWKGTEGVIKLDVRVEHRCRWRGTVQDASTINNDSLMVVYLAEEVFEGFLLHSYVTLHVPYFLGIREPKYFGTVTGHSSLLETWCVESRVSDSLYKINKSLIRWYGYSVSAGWYI
jgi:hypothetical protein